MKFGLLLDCRDCAIRLMVVMVKPDFTFVVPQ